MVGSFKDPHDFDISLNETVDLSKMTEEEKWRYIHQQVHLKHRGHEAMHAWMILILIGAVILAQILLVEWKKRHFKSYQRVSLVGMWLIPMVVCFRQSWIRFLITWTTFTLITVIIIIKAHQKPISGTTPRLVYKWFYAVYMVSYALGVIGYAAAMAALVGLSMIFGARPQLWLDAGLLLIYYGLYYGVLGRDIAEIITDRMAVTIGYYTTSGVPSRQLEDNICAVCGNKVLVHNNEDAIVEKTYKLNCGHTFHEFCIRGWCIIGKKQTCPYCREKVDLKKVFCNPWEKPHVFYGSLLDFIRYLIAWQPVILAAVQLVNYLLGLE